MKLDITEMFCFIDDFCKFIKGELAKKALKSGPVLRYRLLCQHPKDNFLLKSELFFNIP